MATEVTIENYDLNEAVAGTNQQINIGDSLGSFTTEYLGCWLFLLFIILIQFLGIG